MERKSGKVMAFEKRTFSIPIDPSYNEGTSMEAEGYELVGTGLGYSIDPKPEEGRYLAFEVNGVPVYRKHDETRYCPTHVLSGFGFGMWFYSEEHCRAFVERMAPMLDWNQPIEVLKQLPEWAKMSRQVKVVADEVTQEERSKLSNRA